MFEDRLRELDPVFYPRSIAVVGASSDERKSGAKWVIGLRAAGYAGTIYPVSARGGTVAGLEIARSLSSIESDIDYVIASVPSNSVLDLIEECIRKKTRVVQFFTAGFSETGSREGKQLEERMLHRARESGLRVVGPNCIGSYCPEARIPLGPSLLGKVGSPGNIGFISQSGGIAAKLVEIGVARHIQFSKGISVGNSIDLDTSDFLEYFAADSKTRAVGAYMEGTRDGQRLFRTLQAVCQVKPTVVWKGGRTDAGAAAALSHTGSLASSAPVWSAMLRQAGAIEARSIEELSDCLLLLQQLGEFRAENVAIIGGLADGGGGISVSGSDACNDNALAVPELSPSTKESLKALLGEVGSILRNPVDVSPAQFRGLDTLFQAIRLVAEEPAIEIAVIQEDMDIMLSFLSAHETADINAFLARLRQECKKPFVLVLPPGSAETERIGAESQLLQAGVPVFPTMARAARAIALVGRRRFGR